MTDELDTLAEVGNELEPNSRGVAPQAALPVLAAALTAITGFGVLLAFWVLGDWPTSRGLFSFRAATVGDALLLPLLVGSLVAVIRAPSLRRYAQPKRERRLGVIAGLCGALAGIAIQGAWLLDPDPRTNWTFPEPHHFNAPGWWHAVFFVGALAVIASLAVVASLRVRSMRRTTISQPPASRDQPAATAVLAAGLLFGALVVVDELDQTDGHLNAMMVVPIVAGGLLVGGLLLFTFGLARFIPRVLTTAAAIAFGGAALSATGLAAPLPVAIAGMVSAMLVGAALAAPASGVSPGFIVRAVAGSLTLAGGFALALNVVVTNAPLATILVVGSSALATWVASSDGQLDWEMGLTILATSVMLGILLVAAWLDAYPGNEAKAERAVQGSLVLLDIVVLTLIHDRFNTFMVHAQRARFEDGDEPPEASGVRAWGLLLALVISTLASLAVLLAAAAEELGLDNGLNAHNPDLLPVGAAAVAAATCALTAIGLARPLERPTYERHDWIDLRLASKPVPVILVALGAAVLALAFAWTLANSDLTHPWVGLTAAVGIGVLVLEDIVNSPVRLQLHRPAAGTWIVAAASAAAAALATLWLLSVGLWADGDPASIVGCLLATATAVVGPATIAVAAGATNARSLTGGYLTEQAPSLNALVQPLMYGGVIILGFAIPVCIVGRVDTFGTQDAGLATLAAASFIPPLVFTFLWILRNNSIHRRNETSEAIPSRVRTEAENRNVPPEALNRVRGRRLRQHAYFTNWASATLITGGLAWGIWASMG